MRLLQFIIIPILCLLFSTATAGVNIKNGNFYISYTDHDLSPYNGFDITRTYNSKSTDKGLFGFGWGSEIETRLFPIGDGNMLITEYGSGSWTAFFPVENNEAFITTCINQLVKAAVHNEDIENNPVEINKFRRKMRNNLTERFKKWVLYYQKGLVQAPSFPENTRWESQDFGINELIKTKNGFKRIKSDGSYDLFNLKGWLTGNYNTEGKMIYTISYNIKGQITQLKDKGNNIFLFTSNKEGFIQSIKTRQGTSYYWYNGTALVKTKDAGNNIYRHQYDSSFNMVAIYYTDQPPMLIEYEKGTLFCKKITQPNGEVNEYVYNNFYDKEGNVDDSHFATWVFSTQKPGAKTDSSYFEYEIRDKADGSSYQYHYVYMKNGDVYEEINNETCEMPDTIKRNRQVKAYTYNNNCITVTKETDSVFVQAEIDSVFNKASLITYYDKITKTTRKKSFTYNKAGNPVTIHDEGNITTITYTPAQKTERIVSKDAELIYHYNSFQRLQSITLTGVGDLLFIYDKEGALLRKESKKGKDIAATIEKVYTEKEKYIEETYIVFD